MAYEKKFFANSGALFSVANKKSDKAPDLTGDIALGSDVVRYIIEQQRAGNQEITLDLSAWKKVSRSGSKFLSVKIGLPYKKPATAQPAQQSSYDDDDDGEPPF